MIILIRNKSFSKKEKGETKLKMGDRLDIWTNKHLRNIERTRRYLKGEEASPMSPGSAALIGAVTGSVLPILSGGDNPITAALDKKYKKAAVLSVGGAAIQQGLNRVAGSLNKSSLRKNPHANDRPLDILNVAEGKMSEEEFAKKWYKGKSKKN
jgi:hypothetical protein